MGGRWFCIFVIAFLLNGCVSSVALRHVNTTQVAAPQDNMLILTRADFDGDRREDLVLGKSTAVTGSYRTIQVRSATGKPLLTLISDPFYRQPLVASAGAPRPILVVPQSAGNMLRVWAYMYQPHTGRMEPLNWDNQEFVLARDVKVDTDTGQIIVVTWEREEIRYHFRAGGLSKG